MLPPVSISRLSRDLLAPTRQSLSLAMLGHGCARLFFRLFACWNGIVENVDPPEERDNLTQDLCDYVIHKI